MKLLPPRSRLHNWLFVLGGAMLTYIVWSLVTLGAFR